MKTEPVPMSYKPEPERKELALNDLFELFLAHPLHEVQRAVEQLKSGRIV